MSPLFAFDLNPLHFLIIAALLFLFFGNRLPSAMRSLGRGVVEFKKGLSGIEDDQDAGTKPVIPQQTTVQQTDQAEKK